MPPPPPPPPQPPRPPKSPPTDADRALAALHGLAKPKPKVTAPPPPAPPPPEAAPGSGASGFVGMLAQGQLGSGDSHVPPASPDPPAGTPPAKKAYPLAMARELPPAPSLADQANAHAAALRPSASRGPRPRPPRAGRSRGGGAGLAVGAMLGLGGVLLVIGLWAAGALVYMGVTRPESAEAVHYPLVRWSLDVGDMGGYTNGSRVMAWSMLACLPVGLAFVGMGLYVRRRAGGR